MKIQRLALLDRDVLGEKGGEIRSPEQQRTAFPT